ncbi:DUF2235 domain-containing protein [Neptunomonas sp. XY-337]|uniref:DUF2235 domain-containing protein n=1 Tax=Neptunomonas sp. XY-337 TaxID=2561897 RepID=UPI0010AAFC72|nr:DUF2235 domain-containing protein [Neptunomonas sp. XY-337]
MKKLVVSYDGTWNNPEQEVNGAPCPTNVVQLNNALVESSDQIRYYHPGLGGEGGLIKPIVGGAFGAGIKRHICSGYHWLASNYEEGDEIYLFGFSRGAFTARSLAGLLGQGLLDLTGLTPKQQWKRVHQHFENRLAQKDKPRSWKLLHSEAAVPVRFIGVWDTVGALGIPDDLEILNLLDNPDKWRFYDNKLGEHVRCARHAMAIDEKRSSFTVTRWSNANSHPGDVEEKWFPGVHSDIGGGYAEKDLSDVSLRWMMDQAQAQGLEFRDGYPETIEGNPLGVMHNSYKGMFAKMRSRPRNLPLMEPNSTKEFHSSALLRQERSPIDYPAYHPTIKLEPGESITVDVYAGERWNDTGLFLEKGHYVFSSKGEWMDSKDVCDWKGTQDDDLTVGDIIRGAGSVWGSFESLYKKATNNESTDFMLTKRVEEFSWFTMVGAIANDAGTTNAIKNDGSPVPHQYVDLPKYHKKKLALKVTKPGYLYCFPNDVWSLYENNRGSVKLTVKRVK